jgi:hypothetical protein
MKVLLGQGGLDKNGKEKEKKNIKKNIKANSHEDNG